MKKDNRLKYLILGVLAVFLVYWLLVTSSINLTAERGLFGDMFGGLNAFFSALAFAAIAYSIFQQREELALQREELALTRDELAKTAKLNALATLAQTYSESLTWMNDINKSAPDAIAAVSDLHEEVVRETERLCGMSGSLYD